MKYKKDRESSGHGSQKGGGDMPPSIQLDIEQHRGCGLGSRGEKSPWPQEQTPGSGSGHGRNHPSGGREPPEKQLTLFALRLAVLEKAASGFGTLNFVWATVVLLGGFASSLNITDFWCVTVILVGEGARVFSRSHELEWQHHATQTSTAGGVLRSSSRFFHRILHALVDPAATAVDTGGDVRVFSRSHELECQHHATETSTAGGALRSSCWFFRRIVDGLVNPAAAVVDGGGGDTRTTTEQLQRQIVASVKQRTWHAPDVPLIPYADWFSASRKIGRLLNWLQVLSAFACVALSLMRLWKHDFGDGDQSSPKNMRPALLLFYTLALLEASLFLLEKAYWTWKFSFCMVLHQVSGDCHLENTYGLVSLKRFFYDAYSRCIAGSIFDGIKMDLVTFAEELILSDFHDEQLIGVCILQQFAKSAGSAGDTLRKIGTSRLTIERLVDMLNWKRPDEEEVRASAAKVVSKLAGKRQNALRVSSIPGAIESIMSLLYTGKGAQVSGTHPQPHVTADEHEASPGVRGYDYLPFNLLGLLILKKLARDHDNCGKIGNARGLLAKVIDFTQASPDLLLSQYVTESQVRAVKRALQVVYMLVTTTGNTGKALRQGIAENVFAVSNLRDILRYGELHGELQKLAIDVLTGLAMEENGKEAIVGTGGVVKLLLSIFIGDVETELRLSLSCKAGDALAMLALESERSCAAILKQEDVLDQLVSALQDGDERRLNAARVLRNLCAYSGPEHRARLHAATKALPAVLRATMAESDKVLEVSVGLTREICRFIDGKRFAAELRGAGVEEREYVQRLASILQDNKYPKIKVPRMRRFVVLQVRWLMTCSGGGGYMELLREVGMERLLKSIADTTSELECYHVFSGSVGIGKHRENFSSIMDSALELIAGGGGGARAEE
ncbi:uncharacterized protein LOC133900378 [Phragmites australis]|uniref:uncharacterized protein LOC133900378 n=1 Tax=Phragmites australis TaxID=29695 RepID=UPI002D7807BE|nr:uncharacterized protein LOC133900378 [Phragmites australis]